MESKNLKSVGSAIHYLYQEWKTPQRKVHESLDELFVHLSHVLDDPELTGVVMKQVNNIIKPYLEDKRLPMLKERIEYYTTKYGNPAPYFLKACDEAGYSLEEAKELKAKAIK